MDKLKSLDPLKLRHKFYGVSSVLILSLLFTCIFSLMIMGQLNTSAKDVSENWIPSVIIAEELNTATSDYRIAEASHVISQDEATMKIHEETLLSIALEIEAMFVEYETTLVTNEADADLLAMAKTFWSQYLTLSERMIGFSRHNDTEAAMDIMSNESELFFNEVSGVFLKLVNFNKEGAEIASAQSNSMYSSTFVIIAAISILSIFILRMFSRLMKNIEETQEKLRIAHEEAILSSQAKSNFLANMSHEIRTPMNAISGMTDIILRETADSDVTENAYAIKRACDSLLSIINDVLDISKIESGKLEIVEAEYKLSNVLQDVLTIASNRLEDKNLMFITDFQHDLPDVLLGDEVRVKQIMVNILNNAIKFTQSGHISFSVQGEYKNGLFNLKFIVEDTGVGISQEHMEKLFVEFERVNTKKNRSIEGTGLGLAISKRISEMMGGTIEVSSEVGKGTVFQVNIHQKYTDYMPLAKVEEATSVLIFESRELYLNSITKACQSLSIKKVVSCALQSELNESLNEEDFDYILTSSMYHYKVQEILSKKNLHSKIILLADNADIKMKYDYTTILLPAHTLSIANALNGKSNTGGSHETFTHFIAPNCNVLIVDDNLVNLKVAQGLMKPYKFSIDTAENGAEAVKKIKENRYDMVFMDHMMPVMDGIDATIEVRATEGEYFQNLPIVALTANAIVGTEEMFIKEGMNDFLAKPIKIHTLHDILTKWLPKESQLPVENEVDSTKITENEEPSQEEQTHTGGELYPIDIPAVNVRLGVKRTGGDFDSYLNILEIYYKDGVKRIPTIRDFFDNKQFVEYKIEVHALKSASASIGAIDVSEKARLLEDACTSKNWVYINENSREFIDDFEILLENIREALKGIVVEDDEEEKESGDNNFYAENLEKLKEALDNVDINLCDQLIGELLSFHWDKEIHDHITKIKDFVSIYEYDEAIEYIDEII